MSIVIVDSGGANLTSIKNAFEKISSQAVVSIDENIISNATMSYCLGWVVLKW